MLKNERGCVNCSTPIKHEVCTETYDTPFSDLPRILCFCCEDCEEKFLSDSFAYFYCHECAREICSQNPANGWHTQYREVNGEMVCLKCYEKMILKDGIECEDYEKHNIRGMFFSSGNEEAINAGWQSVEGFEDICLNSKESVEKYCNKAIDLINKGYKCLNAWERLAYGGCEGYVTLFFKKDCNKEICKRRKESC